MKNMKNNVVILGPNHHNTLGVVRSLGRKGINPFVIFFSKDKSFPICKSRYIEKFYITDSVDEILRILKQLSLFFKTASRKNKPILIACSDKMASFIDLNLNELSELYICPGAKRQGLLTELMDKAKMTLLAKQSGLKVPYSIEFRGGDFKSNDLIYPCIVKPLKSINGSKSEIRICSTPKELKEYLSLFKNPSFQIQQYIKKTYEYQLIGCALSDKIIIPGKTSIIYQPQNTNTAFLQYVSLDGSEPIKACNNFLRKTTYTGLFSMEFIKGEDGIDYFMEVNFRNDGNAICVTDAGRNLPYIWFLNENGKNYDSEMVRPLKDVYCIPDFAILYLWYEGTVSFIELISAFKKANSHMDYDSLDQVPTLGKLRILRLFILLFVKKIIKRLINR